MYERKEPGNQAWLRFRLCESIDKSFLTDCSATLAVMVIDKTVYSQSISPIVSCSPSQHCNKHQIAACSVTLALNRNTHTHTHTHACTHNFLSPSSALSPTTSVKSNHHWSPQSFLSNLETHTWLTTTIIATTATTTSIIAAFTSLNFKTCLFGEN